MLVLVRGSPERGMWNEECEYCKRYRQSDESKQKPEEREAK